MFGKRRLLGVLPVAALVWSVPYTQVSEMLHFRLWLCEAGRLKLELKTTGNTSTEECAYECGNTQLPDVRGCHVN